MNQDFIDLLRAFIAADVRFLIIGAYALALHGRPKDLGDIEAIPTLESAPLLSALLIWRQFEESESGMTVAAVLDDDTIRLEGVRADGSNG